MTEPAIFFNEVNERQGVFHRRAFIMGGVVTAGLFALGARLADLQIIENNRYKTLATANQYNFRLVPPPRGRIVDRNGVELASNRPNFRLLLQKDQVDDVDQTLDAAAQLIPIPPEKRRQLSRQIENAQTFVPVVLAEDLSWDEFARLNVRTPELPGLQADMGEARTYPFGGAFAHVVGYVSKVTDATIKAAGPNPDPLLLNPGFRIGKQGVEKALDLDLRGKAGGQKVEVDAKGKVVREDPLGDIKPVPGKTVELTLDADIQNKALEVFGAESGAAVMMDCRTGDVLCMYSGPSFDANRFVSGLSGAEYQALTQYDHKPLLNKALTATYPPGSTFKTLVALAALENGYDPRTVHVCGKSWPWGGRVWHCDKAHGAQDLRGAIATSCDIYFYQCALSIGPDKIAAVARRFGLGEIHDIGIPGQKPGLIPDTSYKRKHFPHDPVWHPGETPSMGIGQGYVNVNALQLCVQAARLANGVKAINPRLIHSIGGVAQPSGAEAPDLPLAREHIDFVRSAMGAVTEAGGTAGAAAQLGLGPIRMAGKTGTAQAHNYTAGGHGAHGAVGAWAGRDHAWFICFAPFDDPRYAMSVLVEHGGFGADAAAPKAREIMRVALLKDPEIRARIEKPMPMPDIPASPADGAAPPPPTGGPLTGVAGPNPDQGVSE
ncbi:penicillin-binding protein 2 [Phenylobacterium montanum]|uniref:Penicillin-binding protein 2 n=1 Tax=Phenylobacterium montanum TaxID=2823693 RepID=A0A975G2L7_9CAUL|nr:penicillin-binding protein 2 [Caulobacter sp. S6]QUD89990.1 penicillin-binding protein 2 [Caulobacter sp. S6]